MQNSAYVKGGAVLDRLVLTCNIYFVSNTFVIILFEEFFRDGPRIEAAFRKYFHRATPTQKEDTVEILVCHANVIRYFVCRLLAVLLPT